MVESIKELRKICQDPVLESNPWYGQKVARRVSIYFTKLLLYTPITGNQATLLFILIGVVAGLFFIPGGKWPTFIGALILQLWFVFDCVDGEIARYRKQTSLSGVYLDYVSHYIIHPFIFACIAFGAYNAFQDIRAFIFGFLAAISIILVDFSIVCRFKVVVQKRLEGMEGKEPASQKGTSPEEMGKRVETNKGLLHFAKRVYHSIFQSAFVYPGIMNAITLAAIIDLFIPPFAVMGFNFNLIYLLLIFYAVSMPFIWITTIYYSVRENKTERLWESLFHL
jgi:phosphatidylglycerophosphate synthase